MELAYHELNRREYELTKHVSLRQVDPRALIELRDDRTVHGGPARGAVRPRRPGPLLPAAAVGGGQHPVRRRAVRQRQLHADPAEQLDPHQPLASARRLRPRRRGHRPASATTTAACSPSSPAPATTTAGCSRPTCADERYLPFEGSGAVSQWRLELPDRRAAVRLRHDLRRRAAPALHGARGWAGAARGGDGGAEARRSTAAATVGSTRLLSVRHEFPTEWARFATATVDGDEPDAPLTLTLREEHYPFWARQVEDFDAARRWSCSPRPATAT